jgi:hypothetical protein
MVFGDSDAFSRDVSPTWPASSESHHTSTAYGRAVAQFISACDILSPSDRVIVVLGRGLFDPDPKRLLYHTRLFLRVHCNCIMSETDARSVVLRPRYPSVADVKVR